MNKTFLAPSEEFRGTLILHTNEWLKQNIDFLARYKVSEKSYPPFFFKVGKRAIFHKKVDLWKLGGSHYLLYIIGGGTTQHGTHQQRTFNLLNTIDSNMYFRVG